MLAMIVTVHEAKTQLSKLLAAAEAGEEVIIARRSEPSVRLVPVQPKPKRVFGAWKDKIKFTDDFFDPLPEEELQAWESD